MTTTTTTSTPFLSVPPTTPCQVQLYKQPSYLSRWSSAGQATNFSLQLIPLPRCSSLSSTSASVVEQVEEGIGSPPPDDDDEGMGAQSESSTPTQDSDPLPPPRGCKACGREEIEKGCNGEGRIQGGIATVPGFGWWPIKAYRPCPGFLASGGRYRRVGQSMDEVAFGRGKKEVSLGTNNDTQTRKKKGGPRKFNR